MPPPIEIPKKKFTVSLSDIEVKFSPSKVDPKVYIQLDRILYTLRRGIKDIYEDFGIDQLVQYLMSTETNLLFRQFFQQVQAPLHSPKYLPPMTGLSSMSPLKNFRALRDIESAIKALRKLNGSILHGKGVNVGTQVAGVIRLDGFETGDVGKTVTAIASSWNQTRFNAPQAKTNKIRNFRLDGSLITLKKMSKSTPHPSSGIPVIHPDTTMTGKKKCPLRSGGFVKLTGEWQFHYGVALVEATFTDVQARTHRAHDYAKVFGPTEQDEIHNERKRDGINTAHLNGYISKASRAGSVMGQLPSLLALQNFASFVPGVVDPKTEKAILMLNQYVSAWGSQTTAFNQRMQKTIGDVHSENMKMIQNLPEAGVAGAPEQLS